MIAVCVFHVLFGVAFMALTVGLYIDLRNTILKKDDDDKDGKE